MIFILEQFLLCFFSVSLDLPTCSRGVGFKEEHVNPSRSLLLSLLPMVVFSLSDPREIFLYLEGIYYH
jgi:hypothetical protein